jgi:hypothetical protein
VALHSALSHERRQPIFGLLWWTMTSISYARHQFPPSIIQHAVWLYLRFTLSYRDVEDLLAERGLDLSYETVRRWVTKFGPRYARELIRASRLTSGKTSSGHHGTQSLGCAGQTVRPSLHSIPQTSVGTLLNRLRTCRSIGYCTSKGCRPCPPIPYAKPLSRLAGCHRSAMSCSASSHPQVTS